MTGDVEGQGKGQDVGRGTGQEERQGAGQELGQDNLLDAHTFSLDWQGNIYTVTQHTGTTTKLVVATLNRKVYCLELFMSHCARPCGCVVVPHTQVRSLLYFLSYSTMMCTRSCSSPTSPAGRRSSP